MDSGMRSMCKCLQASNLPNRLSLGYGHTVAAAGFVTSGISEPYVFPPDNEILIFIHQDIHAYP